jgi:triosephosphate isomerase (TIM)
MKKLYIVGNWKSNKTTKEAQSWMATFMQQLGQLTEIEEKTIIVCPPITVLSNAVFFLQAVKVSTPIKLGSQDFPANRQGAYTGEEPADLLKEYVDFALIGHSERRKHFYESDELIEKKILTANEVSVLPILCVQDAETPIPASVSIAAYEPIAAIGTGQPDTPANANAVAKTIKEKHNNITHVLYGGSVTAGNVHDFTTQEFIDGVLVGGASLDADQFALIVKNA